MDQFGIITALEAYAISKGWKFEYRFDNFYANAGAIVDFLPGELILLADFRAEPTYKGARVGEIRYTCLLMLGRKFDLDGQAASLDETAKQKYDRRLEELCQYLALAIGEFACANELEIISAPISVDINVYDTNIDFAISNNAVFLQ